MTKREKIIVGMTGLVAAAAGLFLLLDSGPATRTADKSTRRAQVAETAALAEKPVSRPTRNQTQTSDIEEKLVLDEKQELVLSLLSSGWKRDPFYRPRQENNTRRSIEKDLFLYSGFLNIGGRPYAVINDLQFTEGDLLTGTEWPEYRVKKITPDQVVIVTPMKTTLLVEYHEKLDPWEGEEKPAPETETPPGSPPHETPEVG